MLTIEIIQAFGFLLTALVTIVSIGMAYGKLKAKHEENAQQIGRVVTAFDKHAIDENVWQMEIAQRVTAVETTVKDINEFLKDGWKKPGFFSVPE